MTSIETKIAALGLVPHPEGGYYRQTFVSSQTLPNGRPAATSILFLLTHDNSSNFHRLDAEEIWYYHGGDPLTVHMIDALGAYSEIRIGPDSEAGQVLQAVVPPHVWFGSSVPTPTLGKAGWALVGCMVSPGFNFAGFELADRASLSSAHPEHTEIIGKLTRATD
ncbi:cupin [Litorimonas cladophorae]|uniref:Cupin n=1 Tax=Litorimonas cladophorae TaxID=1220491 RepID=A0A918KAU6_9PROT|nr:cupin domain-containing protein [Litorimonas cladophorae]GGX56934.1 cupin [Litorimonas cladophorae]